MDNQNSPAHKTVALIGILLSALLVIGCGSTDSDTDNDTGPNFDSGLLGPGESFSYTFEEEGTVDYYCRTHTPDMTGQVTVSQGAEITERDTVVMQNSQFNPGQITIAPNTTIVWVNEEGSNVDDHTVTSGSPAAGGNGGGY